MRILTFDVEDWYNHDNYSRDFEWEKFEVRIYIGLEKILSVLEEKKMKGTFFCLGWIAEHHPKIVKDIADAGHHIGCHSYQHELASRFTPEQFREDTYRSKCLIEDVAGCKVEAFRAPSFSITKNNLWAFDVLAELEFKYDSSVFPSVRECGGIPTYPAEPSILRTHSGDLKEFPICLGMLAGSSFVFSGGGYFRVMPYSLLKKWTNRNPYVISYFHPSDFDPGQPQMPQLGLMRQFKNRVGLKGAFKKFGKYMRDFDFIDIKSADSMISWNDCPIVDVDKI